MQSSADLGTPNGAARLAKQALSIVGDRLDVLVLNAGISKGARIADYTIEDFDNLFATNVRSRSSWCNTPASSWCGLKHRCYLSVAARTVRASPLWNPSLLCLRLYQGSN